jgi:hypothetical protein
MKFQMNFQTVKINQSFSRHSRKKSKEDAKIQLIPNHHDYHHHHHNNSLIYERMNESINH